MIEIYLLKEILLNLKWGKWGPISIGGSTDWSL